MFNPEDIAHYDPTLDVEHAIDRAQWAMHGAYKGDSPATGQPMPDRALMAQCGIGYALLAAALQTEREYERAQIERIRQEVNNDPMLTDGPDGVPSGVVVQHKEIQGEGLPPD